MPAKRLRENVMSQSQARKRFKIIPSRRQAPKGRFARESSEGELKFFDTDLAFNVDATAEIPATGQIALVPQGSTQNTRIGRKCFIKSIRVHGAATLAGATANLTDLVFLYVIQDAQCNGAAATVTGDTGIFTAANLAAANMNLSNGQRFRVLAKIVIEFNSSAGVTTAYNAVVKEFDRYIRCNIPMEFDAAATTGALTTIRSNNIFLVAGTSGNADDATAVVGVARLRFSD